MRRAIATAAPFIIIYGLLLTGCRTDTQITSHGTHNSAGTVTPTASATPTPTMTPSPLVSIESLLLRSAGSSTVVLGTAENQSSKPVSGVRIRVQLHADSGRTITASTGLLIENLAPGESSPFRITFDSVTDPVRASAAVANADAGTFKRVQLEMGEPQIRQDRDGSSWVLAEITNPSAAPVCVQGTAAAAFNNDGDLLQLNTNATGPRSIRAGQVHEYYFQFSRLEPHAVLQIFTDSQHCETEPREPDISSETQIRYDSQDNPFLLGSLTNNGSTPVHTEAVLTIRRDGELLSMLEISPPIPLPPEQPVHFTLASFPTLLLDDLKRAQQTGDLEISLQPDPMRTFEAEQPVLLQAFVTGLEDNGSKLIVNGQVQNSRESSVQLPSIFLRITATGGELMTAGWVTAAEAAPAGSDQPFQLILPLPAEADLRLSEYDLRAFGIMGTESAP